MRPVAGENQGPTRNQPPTAVLRTSAMRLGRHRRGGVTLGAMAVATALATSVLCTPAPARAHTRVVVGVGGVLGVPAFAPYPYPYPYFYPYPGPIFVSPGIPPPGWVPGGWEWQTDAWGRRYRVWVPAHLR